MKRLAPSLAAVLALAILAAACSSDPSVPAAQPVVTAVPTPEPTASPIPSPTPEPTAAPTPEMTPNPAPPRLQGDCPANRERSGQTYMYSADELGQEDFFDQHCGPVVFSSNWIVDREQDKLTGTWIITARNETFDYDVPGYVDYTPALIFLCLAEDDDDSHLLISALYGGFPIIDVGGVKVLYRFDNDDPIEDQWAMDTSLEYGAVFVPVPKIRAFVQQIRESNQFVIRAWDYQNDSAGTLTFDLSGFDRDVEPVLQECGY